MIDVIIISVIIIAVFISVKVYKKHDSCCKCTGEKTCSCCNKNKDE